MMRNLIFVCSLLLSLVTFSQNVTENPYVERQLPSQWTKDNISLVFITEEYTMVLWECITSRDISWLSLSKNTSITSKNNPNLNLKIIDWGTFDGEEMKPWDFDVRYYVKGDRKYNFYMMFPSIPIGVENITIRENIYTDMTDEFFWQGIHIQNSTPVSSYNSSSTSRNTSIKSETFEMLGSGTCFALSTNGYLATAYHVVEDAQKIRIRGINGDFNKTFKADVIAIDKNNDLALLKVNDNDFSSIRGIPYTISDKIVDVGESVSVLGYPLRAYMGDEIKLTNGLVSSKTGYQGDVTTYQVSATVQPGNSGGPMFDKNGNVIGVVNSRLYVESASYAVKTPYLRTLLVSSGENVSLPTANLLTGKSLAEQVKMIKKFVYIIEIGD